MYAVRLGISILYKRCRIDTSVRRCLWSLLYLPGRNTCAAGTRQFSLAGMGMGRGMHHDARAHLGSSEWLASTGTGSASGFDCDCST